LRSASNNEAQKGWEGYELRDHDRLGSFIDGEHHSNSPPRTNQDATASQETGGKEESEGVKEPQTGKERWKAQSDSESRGDGARMARSWRRIQFGTWTEHNAGAKPGIGRRIARQPCAERTHCLSLLACTASSSALVSVSDFSDHRRILASRSLQTVNVFRGQGPQLEILNYRGTRGSGHSLWDLEN
jgi:hypothetical protein